MGHLLGVAPYKGKVGILDDNRDALAMPIQRDAMREGGVPTSTPRIEAIVNKAGTDLAQLTKIANVKVNITGYQDLPEGKSWLTQSWSGDLISAALYYLPKNVPPEVLSFWAPKENGVTQNDFFCIGKSAKNPVLAHRFVNYMLDAKVAYDNMINYVGYTPPQNSITADSLIASGLIPKTLTEAVVRPEQFAVNQQLMELSVEGTRYWDAAWAKFKAG